MIDFIAICSASVANSFSFCRKCLSSPWVCCLKTFLRQYAMLKATNRKDIFSALVRSIKIASPWYLTVKLDELHNYDSSFSNLGYPKLNIRENIVLTIELLTCNYRKLQLHFLSYLAVVAELLVLNTVKLRLSKSTFLQ